MKKLQVCYLILIFMFKLLIRLLGQSDGAVEYAECTFAERLGPVNECPGYETGVLVLDKVLSIGQIELYCVLKLN